MNLKEKLESILREKNCQLLDDVGANEILIALNDTLKAYAPSVFRNISVGGRIQSNGHGLYVVLCKDGFGLDDESERAVWAGLSTVDCDEIDKRRENLFGIIA